MMGLALAGCAGLNGSPQFVQELSRQYKSLALNEKERGYDWTDMEYFSSKGERARLGVDVQPEDPTSWGIQEPVLTELVKAYDTLQIALVVDEKKVTKPIDAARAQAYFDCWVEQSQEKFTVSNLRNQCRAAFHDAVCNMYTGGSCPTPDDIHRVFFDTGSSVVQAKAEAVIAAAVAAFRHSKRNVIVAGHADRVGPPDSNLALSRRRADAVMARLVAAGIPAHKIDRKYFGEGQPLVPTADNVANRHNRRVLIVVR